MIRPTSIILFLVITQLARTQTLTVTDLETGRGIAYARISSKNNDLRIFTDTSGQALIDSLHGAEKIRIKAMGYHTILIPFSKLAYQGFSVGMVKMATTLDEQVVTTYKEGRHRHTSVNVNPLRSEDIERRTPFTLSEALTAIPGVTQLSTGNGISKPVIRGLFGNRILIMFNGLRFDNQQWQDEHGLGLSVMGISRTEVIKGPMSLLYGTDAVGGVVNIIEETAPAVGTSQTDVSMDLHSNTLGGNLIIGTKSNFGDKWYRIRAGITNHADYSNGDQERVLNSRFNAYNLKASFGVERKKWQSVNHYHGSFSRFGFIFGDIGHFMDPDKRWTRKMTGPHHIVLLNSFSSLNQIRLKKSMLKVNGGLQSNMRSEDEGGGELSLIMHLATLQYSVKWNKPLTNKTLLILANSGSVENNTNFGKRLIVPDAWLGESAVTAYLKHNYTKLILEYGIGGGARYIHTLLTPRVNSEEKDIPPFAQWRPFVNGMVGASVLPNPKWTVKFNISSGVRAPNLAELSANGLHEGIYTYEIGNPDMDNERNLNVDASVFYTSEQFQINASGFFNHFNGYIYLEPTNEEWFGFPVYRFVQHDARIYGCEAGMTVRPNVVPGLALSATGSWLIGELYRGEFLPYMPAFQLRPEARYEWKGKGRVSGYAFANTDFIHNQNRVNPQEKASPGYQLLNAGTGVQIIGKKIIYDVGLSAKNLLNVAYYSHMSRFKNFDLLNMGRDISLRVKMTFPRRLKKSTPSESSNPESEYMNPLNREHG